MRSYSSKYLKHFIIDIAKYMSENNTDNKFDKYDYGKYLTQNLTTDEKYKVFKKIDKAFFDCKSNLQEIFYFETDLFKTTSKNEVVFLTRIELLIITFFILYKNKAKGSVVAKIKKDGAYSPSEENDMLVFVNDLLIFLLSAVPKDERDYRLNDNPLIESSDICVFAEIEFDPDDTSLRCMIEQNSNHLNKLLMDENYNTAFKYIWDNCEDAIYDKNLIDSNFIDINYAYRRIKKNLDKTTESAKKERRKRIKCIRSILDKYITPDFLETLNSVEKNHYKKLFNKAKELDCWNESKDLSNIKNKFVANIILLTTKCYEFSYCIQNEKSNKNLFQEMKKPYYNLTDRILESIQLDNIGSCEASNHDEVITHRQLSVDSPALNGSDERHNRIIYASELYNVIDNIYKYISVRRVIYSLSQYDKTICKLYPVEIIKKIPIIPNDIKNGRQYDNVYMSIISQQKLTRDYSKLISNAEKNHYLNNVQQATDNL